MHNGIDPTTKSMFFEPGAAIPAWRKVAISLKSSTISGKIVG